MTPEIIPISQQLADRGLRVIVAGLDTDFRGEPFGPMPVLMAKAEVVDKLHAICMVCGESASRTQRLVDGNPARYDDPVVIVGADELYEARCRSTSPGPKSVKMQDYHEFIEEILVDNRHLQKRIAELGAQISQDYQGMDLHLICILRGGVVFMTDLMRYITVPHTLDFMAVSSYGTSRQTTGQVRITYDLKDEIHDRNVLLVEDIVDSGYTIASVLDLLRTRHPQSLRVCTMLNKPERREVDVPVDYCGFVIPNKFVFGYGLGPGRILPQPPLHRHRQPGEISPGVGMNNLGFPPPVQQILERIVTALPPGTPAYLVGGAVRDLLCSRPTHDLDFALPRNAIRTGRQLANALDTAFYPLDLERDTGRLILIR